MTARQVYSVWQGHGYAYYVGETVPRPVVRVASGLHLGVPLETVMPIVPANARLIGHGGRALGTMAHVEAAR